MILTASVTYSQDFIQISTEQAKEAIKTKQRVQVLEVAITQQGVVITKLQSQVSDLEKQVSDTEAQNALWRKNYGILETRFEAEKAKKPKNTVWEKIGIGAGAFLVGFFFAAVK